jgi:hypothetical protein
MLTTDGHPSGPAETGKKKQQAQQPRQLLSCTKCRDRKVKVRFNHIIYSQRLPLANQRAKVG